MPARKECGQVLVELALVCIIFFIISLGIFDIGRLIFRLHQLTQVAREGARVASLTPSVNTPIGKTRVTGQMTKVLIAMGIDVATVTILIAPFDTDGDGILDVVDVTVQQNFLTGIGVSFIPGLNGTLLNTTVSMPVFTIANG